MAGKLIHTVRGKFKDAATEGLLNRVENDSTPQNIDKVQDELVTQMEEDDGYTAQLQNLVNQLKAAGVVRQVMASSLEVEETQEAGAMTQTALEGADARSKSPFGYHGLRVYLPTITPERITGFQPLLAKNLR